MRLLTCSSLARARLPSAGFEDPTHSRPLRGYTVKFEVTLHYKGESGDIETMLRDPDMWRCRARVAQMEDAASVSLSTDEHTRVVTARFELSTKDLPVKVPAIVPASVGATFREAWPGTEGACRMEITTSGVPVRVEATSAHRVNADGLARWITGEVTCALPLVGRRVEQEIVSHLNELAQLEARAHALYIARSSSRS